MRLQIMEPIFDTSQIQKDFLARVQYLDLSMTTISPDALMQLFSKCRQLRKLSLEHVHVNDAACKALAQNRKLEVLNLAMCTGLTTYGLRKMLNAMKWYIWNTQFDLTSKYFSSFGTFSVCTLWIFHGLLWRLTRCANFPTVSMRICCVWILPAAERPCPTTVSILLFLIHLPIILPLFLLNKIHSMLFIIFYSLEKNRQPVSTAARIRLIGLYRIDVPNDRYCRQPQTFGIFVAISLLQHQCFGLFVS